MIKRARLFFFAALAVAAVIVVANFPLGALIGERSAVRADTAQLSALRAADRTLISDVRALHDPSTVGRIAHSEYGLIVPGQRSIVVLPGAAGSSTAGNPLGNHPIPRSDVLPSDAILAPGLQAQRPPTRGPGFWHRVLGSLEFWHSLF